MSLTTVWMARSRAVIRMTFRCSVMSFLPRCGIACLSLVRDATGLRIPRMDLIISPFLRAPNPLYYVTTCDRFWCEYDDHYTTNEITKSSLIKVNVSAIEVSSRCLDALSASSKRGPGGTDGK